LSLRNPGPAILRMKERRDGDSQNQRPDKTTAAGILHEA
jgi:hypothetical protein